MPFGSLGRMLGYDLAIDPGSESVKALARSGEVVAVPSLIARVDPSRGGFLRRELVGEAARTLAARSAAGAIEGRGPPFGHASPGLRLTPVASAKEVGRARPLGPGIEVIRPIARGAVTDLAAASRLFAHVFQEAPRRTWGARPRVLAGAGPGLTSVERRALVEALERAGARSVRLVPSLAACAFALERPGGLRRAQTSASSVEPSSPMSEGAAHLVLALGAERTGVGIASRAGVFVSGSVPLGFADFDRSLASALRRRGLAVSAAGAARLREALGLPAPFDALDHNRPRASPACATASLLAVPASTTAPRGTAGQASRGTCAPLPDVEDVLPRHVGAALGPFLRLIADEALSVLARAPEGAAEDLIERGAVLAGAPAATPGLADFFRALLSLNGDIPVRVSPEPASLCVRGLARLLEERAVLDELE